MALIAAQKLQIAKLQRQIYGQRSERSTRLIDQLALSSKSWRPAPRKTSWRRSRRPRRRRHGAPLTRRRAERDTFPDHLPRERVVIDPPATCACCGGNRLRKLGEGRVEVWRGDVRPSMSVSAPFVWRCLSGSTVAPFPHPAHRTGRADFPHPALGQDLTPSFACDAIGSF